MGDVSATTGPAAGVPVPGPQRSRRPRRSRGLTVWRGGEPIRRSKVKQVLVAVVGGLVAVVGVALLALPGPGFLLVAAGLAILATQFRWARKPLRYASVKAQQGIDEVAKSVWRTLFAVACGAALVAVGVIAFTDVEIPYVGRFLNALTGGTLIASGLFLMGLVVYARRTGGVSAEGTAARRQPGQH